VQFNATTAPTAASPQYEWDIDGKNYSGATAEHTFEVTGVHPLQVRVTTAQGSEAVAISRLTVVSECDPLPEHMHIVYNCDGGTVCAAGEGVNLSLEPAPPEDTCSRFEWRFPNQPPHAGMRANAVLAGDEPYRVEVTATSAAKEFRDVALIPLKPNCPECPKCDPCESKTKKKKKKETCPPALHKRNLCE
jgi:hypothetical protein